MSLAVRFSSDSPQQGPLPGLVVEQVAAPATVAALQNRTVEQVEQRFADGHRAYVAFIDGAVAAFGWVATRKAEIGELETAFVVPAGQRYLWNFVTLPAHRGKGIYPRLLDAIVRLESRDADCFWIAYAPENAASASGIHKAGFTTAASLLVDRDGNPWQCWRCARTSGDDSSCRTGKCCCDYQKPREVCNDSAP